MSIHLQTCAGAKSAIRLSNRILIASLAFQLTVAIGAAQEPQIPPGNPPQEPPAGAANGPRTGPGGNPTAGPEQRTGPNAQTGNSTSRRGDFLAIGPPPDPAAVQRGQNTFVATCGFCHGSNANGGNSGPDLVRSVLVLHDKGTGTEIGPVILNGRPDKGMPKFSLTEAQIKDIAAFLLSRTQAAANRMEYKILNVVTGEATAGKTYFDAHCSSCHSPSGDLSKVATKYDPSTLQSRFLYPETPRRRNAPGPPPDPKMEKKVTVTLASGQSYSGTLDHLDDFSVSLTEASGEHHSWLLENEKGLTYKVQDPLAGHAELLPQYSDADMHNILAYLETLK